MLLITGANGNFAQAVLRNMAELDVGKRLVVGTRNPDTDTARALAASGVEVRRLDFDDPATLDAAFFGIERALIIPTMAPNDRRLGQNLGALNAAKAQGVAHVIYASFINASDHSRAEHSRLVHYPTEQAIQASGLDYTILRHSLYAEIMTGDLDTTLATGQLQRAAGSARCAYMARDDLGISAARILAEGGHEGRIYTETMAETLSGPEIAGLMSEVFGRPVDYVEVAPEAWPDYMNQKWGVPLEAGRSAVGTMQAVASGEFDIVSSDYSAIVGQPPRSFRAFLESVRDSR